MATHKSAEKRARQSVRKQTRNNKVKASVRTIEKKLKTALTSSDVKAAQEVFNEYMSKMSKAAAKNVVHAKKAARKIGQLAAKVSKLAKK